MANANFIVQNGLSVGGATGANISVDSTTGALVFSPAPTAAVPNPTAVVFTVTGGVTSVATTGGVASAASITTANSATTGTINGNLTVTGNLTVQGTTTTVNTEIATGNFLPSANLTYNLGSTTAWWNNIYGTATHALYADLAENYQADKLYAPGTVVMFGGDFEVTIADADTSAVAGVVSTNPAHLMNGGLTGQNVAAVALQGRVPCSVIGPVKKGDLMVSAGHGFAKSATNPAVGTVIGKSLYDYPGHGKAVIEVVVGRV